MIEQSQERTWREILRLRSDEFYALYSADDMLLTKRVGGALWVVGMVVALLALPLAPPDRSTLGDAGWPLAVALVVCGGIGAFWLLRWPARVSPNALLANAYATIVLVAILMWLSDTPSVYAELLLLATLFVAGVHPPRRVVVYLGAVTLALATPLLYESGGVAGAELIVSVVVWGGVSLAASLIIARMRIQRAGLRLAGDQARNQARVDSLTGLGNRRAFDEALLAASERARRNETPLSVIVADLDSFKSLNDRHGLPIGDRYLREVAEVLGEVSRAPDRCFRWGGDEFVIVADVDRPGALKLGARLGAAVAERCRRPDGEPLRLHIGAAQLGPDGDDPEALLVAASLALKPAQPTAAEGGDQAADDDLAPA